MHNIGSTYYGARDLVKQKRCICPEKLIFSIVDLAGLFRFQLVRRGRVLRPAGVVWSTLAKTAMCLILVLGTRRLYALEKEIE
jgi:hypothetical protein